MVASSVVGDTKKTPNVTLTLTLISLSLILINLSKVCTDLLSISYVVWICVFLLLFFKFCYQNLRRLMYWWLTVFDIFAIFNVVLIWVFMLLWFFVFLNFCFQDLHGLMSIRCTVFDIFAISNMFMIWVFIYFFVS